MLSRIFWIALAGVALIGGIIYQNGSLIDLGHSDLVREQAIEAKIGRTVENHLADHVTVVTADGHDVTVPRETKKALGEAVSELVAAKAELAILRARNADTAEIQAVERRSEQARARVERLKEDIDEQKRLSHGDRDAIRTQIREDVREAVRGSLRG